MQASVVKADAAKGLVYGWASVVASPDGALVEDHQGDQIEPDVLEDAAVDFMLEHRATGLMHVGKSVGTVVESFVQTPAKLEAMGFPAEVAKAQPIGLWIGVKVPPEVFAKVQDGTYRMFSIQGVAQRTPV